MAASFNPFLVRASVYCADTVAHGRRFTRGRFQSLLSQGISLLPGKIIKRLRQYGSFQSLLSQGISLLGLLLGPLSGCR